MIISIASGKGGTGKTTVATSLALSFKQEILFLDCDVEEPNAGFFIKPRIENRTGFGIPIPKVDFSKCNFCGRCSEVCAYNAIAVVHPVRYTEREDETIGRNQAQKLSNGVKNNVLIFPELCHGCGSCSALCPEEAITEGNKIIGVIEEGRADNIRFIQGKLNIGEPMATPIIREMKRKIDHNDITIIDIPPGTSCPVIEALKDSDYTILVTEPTPFGLYDLSLAAKVLDKLKIRCGIVINRDGIGDDSIEKFSEKHNIPILARIPIKREIAQIYAQGKSLIKLEPITQAIAAIKEKII